MFLDGTEGCDEEDQIGRAVPAQHLPVGVKQRWMRQPVRGVQARKASDNEQMSWYFAQEESMEFNLQHTQKTCLPPDTEFKKNNKNKC